jgi:hypothetical protein
MHKMPFGQAYCQDILTKIIKKFISYFLSFISFSMYFRILYEFLKSLKENEKKWKTAAQCWAGFWPMAWPHPSGPVAKSPGQPMQVAKWAQAGAAARLPVAVRPARCGSVEGVSMRGRW